MVSWRRLVLALLLGGCGDDAEPLTQLVLVADSDVELDTITFEARAAGGFSRIATASRAGLGPSFVSLVQDDGPLTDLTITATGRKDNKVVLARTHVVSFVPDHTRVVPLDLYASCVMAMCPPDQTCAEMGCRRQALADAELLPWEGEPKSRIAERDAGSSDAGGLQQCGGPVPVDTWADPMNCGKCDKKCKAMERCELGACKKP